AGLTEVLGHHMDASCSHPESASALAFGDLVEALSVVRRSDLRWARKSRRARFEVRGLFGQARRAHPIEQRLLAIRGVTIARANARSGRVLVKTSVTIGGLQDEIERTLRELSDERAPAPPSPRRIAAGLVRRLRQWTEA